MAGFLPYLDLLYILSAIVLAVITILTFYRYLSLDKRLSDLLMSIGFLLLTVCLIEAAVYSVANAYSIFFELNLGRLEFFVFLLGLIVLLIGMIAQVRGGE